MSFGELISAPSYWVPEYVQQSSWIEHGPFAFWLVDALRPRTIVELGTHWGYSYFTFCQAVARLDIPARCFAVDTWQGDEHSGFYGEEVFKQVNDHSQKHYSSFSRLVRATFDEASSGFENKSIDLLHIDGRHYYDDVKHNFESWNPKLSERSVIIFHDTNVRERGFGVFKLWAELAPDFPHFEFYHGHGLGVLGFGENLPKPVKDLLEQDEEGSRATRLAYAQLGRAVSTAQEVARLKETLAGVQGQREADISELRLRLNECEAEASELRVALAQCEAKFPPLLEGIQIKLPRFLKSRMGLRFRAIWRHPTNAQKRKAFRSQGIFPTHDDYQVWIKRHDVNPIRLGELVREIAALPERPLISVVMPVYNTPEGLLREAIDSVQNQIYGNWELCIADDCSTRPHIRRVLENYATREPRIKLVFRAETGHISNASNSAFELVTGEWVALLDHDDVLRPHALAEVALEIARHPRAELVYSDEDKLNSKGERYSPYFKPDFSRELFRTQNYLNHLTVHRAANIRAVGGWRPGFEGSQDYDLNLRIFEQIDMANIRHIPKILYHWRAVDGSTALSGSQKSYAYVSGLRALKEHVSRLNLPARAVEAPGTPFYRMHFLAPKPEPLVSLIIPARDQMDLTRACVESIREKTTYGNYEIIVVDNGSTEPETLAYFDKIAKHPNIRVLKYDRPFNYSAINNFATAQASGSIVGLINNDIEVISPDWLTEMVSWAVQPDVGCVGGKLYYADDTIQHAGVILGLGGVAGHANGRSRHDLGYFGRALVTSNFSAVTAACLLVRKSTYEQVGGLNEVDLTVAFNDVDFCLKVREAGYKNVWTPYAEMYHFESRSRGYEDTPEKRRRFLAETTYMREVWGPLLDADPYYSINLSKDSPFMIAC